MANEIGYKTSRTYHFDVEIAGKNYSSQLTRFRMLTSLVTSWQVFYLDFKLDPFDVILDDGFLGQNPIKVKAFFMTEDEIQQEYIPFELMVIGGLNVHVGNKPSLGTSESDIGSQIESIMFQITCVERDAFKKMTSIVNAASVKGLTIEEILETLCKGVGLTLNKLESSTINKTKIPQFVIPPTTLTKAIEYLDESFGIYKGPTFSFCITEDPDSNNSVLYVMNLAKQLESKEVITLYQQATDSEENEEISRKTIDGDKFMIYRNIKTGYSGNTKLALLSKKMNYIIKPKDSLFKIIEKDLIDMCGEVGINYQNKDIQFDSNLEDRTRYFIDHPGNDEDEAFISSFVGKKIANLTTAEITLSRNLRIEHFLEIGSAVKLETKTAEYQGLGGKYIIFITDMVFNRPDKEWVVNGKMSLVRTNKFSGQ